MKFGKGIEIGKSVLETHPDVEEKDIELCKEKILKCLLDSKDKLPFVITRSEELSDLDPKGCVIITISLEIV